MVQSLRRSLLSSTWDFSYLRTCVGQIQNICSKARKLLGLLYGRYYKCSDQVTLLQLYISLVRPHLEYAAPVWDPHLQRDIQLLERTQKFACRMSSKTWDAGYGELLFLKMCTVFKIVRNLCYFPPDFFSTRESRTYTHRSYLLTQPFARTNSYFYSFVPNSVLQWNSLPEPIISKPSLPAFKHSLLHHLY